MKSRLLKLVVAMAALLQLSSAFAEKCDITDPLEKLLQSSSKIDEEARLLEEFNKKEGWLNRLKNMGGRKDRAARIERDYRIDLLDSYLAHGDVTQAKDILNAVVIPVETTYSLLLKNQDELRALQKALETATPDQVITIQNRIALVTSNTSELNKKFGKEFGLYNALRSALDHVADASRCKGVCQQTATRVANQIGMNEVKGIAPTIFNGRKPADLEDMRRYLDRTPEAIAAKKKAELVTEVGSLIKMVVYQKPFEDVIIGVATHVPALKRTKFIRIAKLFYDARAVNAHFPLIRKVLRSRGGIKGQFEQLRNYESVEPDVLVTFARRTDNDARDAWKQIKARAETEGDADFLAKMTEAEVLAKARGGISPFDRPSAVARFAIYATSGAGLYTLYRRNDPDFESLWDDATGWIEDYLTADPDADPAAEAPAETPPPETATPEEE